MDPNTIATIVAFLVLTFADQGMTMLWAWRLGPNRARDMILSDPLFTELRDTLSDVNEQLTGYKGELAEVRNDMRSMREFIDGSLSSVKGDVRLSTGEAVKGLPEAISGLTTRMELFTSAKADITIPDAEIRRVTSSVQGTIRTALKDGALLEGIDKLLDEKMKALPQGDDLEGLLQDADMSTTEGKQATYEWLLDKNLPEPYAWRVAEQGGPMLRKVAKIKGWDILELLEGAD